MARMILLVTILAAAALSSQAANLRTTEAEEKAKGPALKQEWTEHKNTNINGEFDYKGCALAMGKDVRAIPAKVSACKATCEKDSKCKAIVFHKWGVMMKKAVGTMDEEGKSGEDYLTFVKVLKPVDCVMGEWTKTDANDQPTTCSKKCGGGTQKESRKITTPAANGGKECEALQRNAKCATEACPYEKVGNFNMGGNESPGACSKQGDIRKNKDDMKVCFDECNAKPECKAIVFHKWGTMMKSKTKKSGPFNKDYDFYEKP